MVPNNIVTQERIQRERARANAWSENSVSLAERKEFRDGYEPGFDNNSQRVPSTIDSFSSDAQTLRICRAVIWGEIEENESVGSK